MKHTTACEHRWTVRIKQEDAGRRLDHVLAECTGISRSRIQKLIREQRVFLTQGECKQLAIRAATKVEVDQIFEVVPPAAEKTALQPEAIPLDILYEDDFLLVVNKAAGMVVHPSAGHDHGTLVHALLNHCTHLPGINGVERPGIVHRLDKDTSGALVVAKTETAHHRLVTMFSKHELRRQYLAWCRGTPGWVRKRFEAPIGRHPNQRKKMHVRRDGKVAVTEIAVERRYNSDFCRLRLTLHTGRTHQIRVHLSHLHLPVLGDTVYGRSYHPGRHIPEPARSIIEGLRRRQALHAEFLAFTHPVTGRMLTCIAPLPEELRSLDAALEASYG